MSERFARLTSQMLSALLPAMKRAVDWMDILQPDGAVISHHGLYLADNPLLQSHELRVQFCHVGFQHMPVFIFGRPAVYEDEATRPHCPIINRFDEPEIDALRLTVLRTAPTDCDWNGLGLNTFSVLIETPPGAGAMQLSRAYGANCPEHKQHFCCNWVERGYKLAHLPEGWR